LLPSILEAVPKLLPYFPGGKVTERNQALAVAALDIATKTTGAVNAQAAAEKVAADPSAKAAVAQAVDDNWAALHKMGEDSIAAARQFAVAYASNNDVRTVIGGLTFLEVMSLLLVVSTLAGGISVLIWGGVGDQLKGAIVTLMLVGGFTQVGNFWFGSSLGSKKKDDKEAP
jgi:hypothetical protein